MALGFGHGPWAICLGLAPFDNFEAWGLGSRTSPDPSSPQPLKKWTWGRGMTLEFFVSGSIVPLAENTRHMDLGPPLPPHPSPSR